MKKVETIDLNGRAYKLDEDAYRHVRAYFDKAEKTLADNPDRQEIISDLEQAIADKLQVHLTDKKEVVSLQAVTTALEQIGEVSDVDDSKKATTAAPRTKRLYVIPEGAMLVGVCNGIAAYFGISAAIVRVVFVLLTAMTSGFWILVYFALALLLPYAKTPEQIAEAYDRPVTAHDIMNRVEAATSNDGVAAVGRIITRLALIALTIVRICAALLFGILTFALLYAMAMLFFGRLHLSDELAVLNGWREGLIIGLVYVLAAAPLVALWRVCYLASGKHRSSHKSNIVGLGLLGGLWVVAALVLSVMGTLYASNMRDYADMHNGYIDIGKSHICVNGDLCGPQDTNPDPSEPPEPIGPSEPVDKTPVHIYDHRY